MSDSMDLASAPATPRAAVLDAALLAALKQTEKKDDAPKSKLAEIQYDEGEYPAYIAVDTEGLGAHLRKYPTVAVAFAVFTNKGRLIYTFQAYLPHRNLTKDDIEPRCRREFWDNREKTPEGIWERLVQNCNDSPYKDVQAGWRAVDNAIQEIYDIFGPIAKAKADKRLSWVSDHPAYDVGRLNYYLCEYVDRQEVWYNGEKYHFTNDAGEGIEAMKQLHPDLHTVFKQALAATGYSKKKHDCVEDAKFIGAEYALYTWHLQQSMNYKK